MIVCRFDLDFGYYFVL